MRIILISICLLSIFLHGCKKEQDLNSALIGTWKLVEINDKSTSSLIPYPPGSSGDIIIHFTETGIFSGNTLKNTFSQGKYTLLNDHEISFGTIFESTKVVEDSWGGAFYTVLNVCMLSSTYPCPNSRFEIKNNFLSIISPLRYNLKLKKIN